MAFFDPSEWDGKLYSSGWADGSAGTEPVIEPATGQTIGNFGTASPEDVIAAAAAAAAAQRSWAACSYELRSSILRRAGVLMQEHADVVGGWLTREAGCAKGKAAFEMRLVSGAFHAAAAVAMEPYGRLLHSSKPRLSLSRRIPVGVVGVIAPFNAPQILSIRSVAPALALGNAVVLKPDPRTAVSGGLVLAAILHEAGLPDGLFHVLPGGADVGSALVVDPAVRVISFTGSTNAGRAVGELGARHLKRVHLELGGNNALLVLDDVDVQAAVSAGAWGSFLHQGQICMATGRQLVHESIYDEYVERLSATAEGLSVGNGATSDAALGPVIDAHQRDRIHSLVRGSIDAGARLAAGGTYEGLFYRPTVLAESTPDQPAFGQEVFGPVAPVMKFKTLDEAVEIVNRSEYGLSLGILTRDALRGFALSDRMHSGMVHINDQTVDNEAGVPFGGIGDSGTGSRFGGSDANIEAFTETQWVTMQSEVEQYVF